MEDQRLVGGSRSEGKWQRDSNSDTSKCKTLDATFQLPPPSLRCRRWEEFYLGRKKAGSSVPVGVMHCSIGLSKSLESWLTPLSSSG